MPKLPDKTALGGPSSFRTGRAMADFPGVNTSAAAEGAAIGQGLQGFGNAIAKAGAVEFEAETQRRNKVRREDDSLDLIKADAYHEKHLAETERGFDTDPDFQNYDLKFQPLAATITTDAAGQIRNPKLREKWVLSKAQGRNESARNRILDRGLNLNRQTKEVEVEEALKSYGSVYADPNADDARRGQVLNDMHATVGLAEQSGLLAPSRAQAIREKYIDGTLAADAERRAWDDPDAVLAELEDPKSPRYAKLAPDRRRALIHNVKEAQRPLLMQDALDAIEIARRTGEAPVGSDGKTAIERSTRYLTANQAAKVRLAYDEAKLEHSAVSPLFNMSDDAAVAHLTSLVPDAGKDDESYRSAVRVEQKANQAWQKIKELRAKDPAAAVAQSPAVKQIEATLDAASARDAAQPEAGGTLLSENRLTPIRTRQMVIEARKQAQRDLGLSEWQIKPITRAEGAQLLDMPEPASITDRGKVIEYWQKAANRADEIYGPELGREVFEAALSFQRRDNDEKEVSSGILASMARGETVKPSQFRKVDELSDIDRIGRTFYPAGIEAERPAIGRGARGSDMPTDAFSAARNAVPIAPGQKQIDWVLQDPEKRQQIFDLEFGAGATARAIEAAKQLTR
jgi:hypothetical protein